MWKMKQSSCNNDCTRNCHMVVTNSQSAKQAVNLEAGPGEMLNEAEVAAAEDKETHSFEYNPAQVKIVKHRCLPSELNYPMLEEYDFRNDNVNHDLDMELKSHAQPRPYQENSLSKMFGNGRARFGIIVFPCGAGKSKSAKKSMKKKRLHVTPWRRAEYFKSKWLSPYVHADQNSDAQDKQEPVHMLSKSVGSTIFDF